MASVYKIPNFAVLCSFFERYGEKLQLPDLTIPELQIALEHENVVVPELKDIFFKLLKRIVKSINREKWERKLVQLIGEHYSEVAAWEIEKLGFVKCRLETKIEVLKYLCETQFDDNIKFKNKINDEEPEQMRVQPIGRDKMGLVYWFQKDQDTNLRVYREEQDDEDSSTWEMVSTQRDELASLINTLKSGSNQLKVEEDSESTSDSIGAIEKAVKAQLRENGDSKEESVLTDDKENSKPKGDSQDEDGASRKTDHGETDAKQDTCVKEKQGEVTSDNSGETNDGVQDVKNAGTAVVKRKSDEKEGGGCKARSSSPVEDTEKGEDTDKKQTMTEEGQGSDENSEKQDENRLKEGMPETSATASEKVGKEMRSDGVKKADDADQEERMQPEKESEVKGGHRKQDEEVHGDQTTDKLTLTGPSQAKHVEGDIIDKNKDSASVVKDKSLILSSDDLGEKVTDLKEKPCSQTEHEAQPLISSSEMDKEAKHQAGSQSKTVIEKIRPEDDAGLEEQDMLCKDANSNDTDKQVKTQIKDEGMDCIKKDDDEKSDTSGKIAVKEGEGARKSPSHKNEDDVKQDEIDASRIKTVVKSSNELQNRTESVIKYSGEVKKKVEKESDKPTSGKEEGVMKSGDDKVAETGEVKSVNKDKAKGITHFKKRVLQEVEVKERAVEGHSQKDDDSPNKKEAKVITGKGASDEKNNERDVGAKSGVQDDAGRSKDEENEDADGRGSDLDGHATDDNKMVKVQKTPEKDEKDLKESKDIKCESVKLEDISSEGDKLCSEGSADKKDGVVTNCKDDKDRNRISKSELKIKTEIKSEQVISEGEGKNKDAHLDSEMTTQQNGKVAKEESDVKKKEVKVIKAENFEECTKDSKDDVRAVVAKTEKVEQDEEDENKTEKCKNKRKINEIESDDFESSRKKGKKEKDVSVSKKASVESEEKEKDADDSDEESDQRKTNKKGKSKTGPVRVMPRRSSRSKKTVDLEQDDSKENEEDDSEENEESEDGVKNTRKKLQSKKGRPKKRPDLVEDDEEEESEDTVKSTKKKPQTKKGRPKKHLQQEEEEEDEEESEDGVKSTKKKLRTRKGRGRQRLESDEDGEEEEEEEESEDEAKNMKKRQTKKGRAKKHLESDEEEEEESEVEVKSAKKKPKTKKSRAKKNLESDKEEEESEDEVTITKVKLPNKKGRAKKRFESEEEEEEEESEDEVKSTKKKPRTKKGRAKKHLESDEDEEEEDEEEEEEEDTNEEESAEDEESTKKAKAPAKKGRKRKRGRMRYAPKRKASSKATAKLEEICAEEDEDEDEDEYEPEDENDQPCCKCKQYNHPEWILLCDKCDSGYHTACLRPPLMVIPDGNWYCPTCEHAELIVKLENALELIDAELKKRQKKEKRQKRSTKWAYTDLCMENILPEEQVMVRKRKAKRHAHAHAHSHSRFRDHSRSPSRSRHSRSRSSRRSSRKRRHQDDFVDDFEDYEVVTKRSTRQRKQISYKFEDFDEAINSAIHEEVEEHKKFVEEAKNTYGISRGKDMSNILGAEAEDEEEEEDEQQRKARRGKRRKLMDLDATSEEDSDQGDDFKLEESEPDSDEGEEDLSGSDASGDSGVVRPRRRSKRKSKWGHLPRRKSERNRQRGHRTRYHEDNTGSSSSFEAEEESDGSAYSDDSGRARRRSASRRSFSYREKSDSETEEGESTRESSEESRESDKKPKSTKKDYETSSGEEDDETYSRKRKFVLQSDEEEEEEAEEEDEGKEDDEEKKPRTVVKKAKKQEKRNRHEDNSDREKEDNAELERKKRTRSKRVDYKKMAEGDSDGNSEEKEEEEEKSASKQNHKTSQSASNTEDTTKGSIAKESLKAKISDSERTSIKFGAIAGTQSPSSLNGGETLFNGDDDEDDDADIGDVGSGEEAIVGGDVDDEDLLNVTDLVEFVTQDS